MEQFTSTVQNVAVPYTSFLLFSSQLHSAGVYSEGFEHRDASKDAKVVDEV